MIHTYGVDSLAWERINGDTPQDSESDAQYYAFMFYCSMPASGDNKRTLVKVTEEMDIAYSTAKSWARQFSWDTRASKFDDFMRRYTAGTLAIANIFDDETIAMTKTWVTDRAGFKDSIRQNLANNIILTNALIKGVIRQTQAQLESGDDPINPKSINDLLFAVEKQDNLLRRLVGMPTNYRSEDVIDDTDDDTVFVIGGME